MDQRTLVDAHSALTSTHPATWKVHCFSAADFGIHGAPPIIRPQGLWLKENSEKFVLGKEIGAYLTLRATFAKSRACEQNWSAKLGGDEVHRMPSHLKLATPVRRKLYMVNLRPITRPAGQNLVVRGSSRPCICYNPESCVRESFSENQIKSSLHTQLPLKQSCRVSRV